MHTVTNTKSHSHICLHIRMHKTPMQPICTMTHTHAHAHTNTHMLTHIHTHAHTHTCTHAHTYLMYNNQKTPGNLTIV